jgi:ABC-2 type transport system ATP-binding protein
MTTSIQLENVTKSFSRRYQRTLKQVTVAKVRGQHTIRHFNAVDDVSITVEQGESIGLMGLNGSGKSTLLKLINGVMRPDSGQVLTRGRIAGLIATGAGFHPQLSGRENLILNAAILGMTEAETNRKFDEIVDFAELGDKLDSQVGHYSSGESARLGFSIAIHVDSDIFLADEVLAVGDRPFKQKCLQKMEEIRDSGRTLFYVSHSAGSVRRMCNRVVVLEKGRVGFDGGVDEGIHYLHYDDDGDAPANEKDKRRRDRSEALDDELGADI